MIKPKKRLTIMHDEIEPDEAQAVEIVLEHNVMLQDALLHIGTCTGYVMTLGKRSHLKFYDLDKLKAAGVYVHRRPYGGSGTIYGPRDVLLSLYVNKETFENGYDVDSAKAYRLFTGAICSALHALGVKCHIDTSESRRQEDGVCVHLQGRSEIVTDKGTKMAVSVFREDELGFYMRCMLLVTTDWADVYEYLISPTKPMQELDSIEMQLGHTDATDDIIDYVTDYIAALFDYNLQIRRQNYVCSGMKAAVEGIKNRFRVI